jgi:hypothetical protein
MGGTDLSQEFAHLLRVHDRADHPVQLAFHGADRSIDILMFRFTKIWEKIIVIIREKRSVGIVINEERVEPRLA